MESSKIDKCAACGKEGGDSLKACTACFMVKYCNGDCQISHRRQHKKECKKRAAELYDEKLFKELPPEEECPICLLPLPLVAGDSGFHSCCGKVICNGCIYAMVMSEEGGADLCPYCRLPVPSLNEELVKRTEKLMAKGNACAYYTQAGNYAQGIMGLQQDPRKACELWLKSGELGYAKSYNNLGESYIVGRGVEVNLMKAKHYWELAAMMGNAEAQLNLGFAEGQAGNYQRAFKHFIIAARAGSKESLDEVKRGFMNGLVTKDEYANTLRAYHERHMEMKSDQRDKAAANIAANGL